MAKQEEEEERSARRVELGRPRTPEPMNLGMPHLSEEDGRRLHSPKPPSVIDELFQHLTTLSNQLESTVELLSSLQAQHTAAQSTTLALESKVVSLETLVKSQAAAVAPPPPPEPEPAPPSSKSLTQILSDWKKSVEGQWPSVGEEWASERERLAFTREEWESKVKTVRRTWAQLPQSSSRD
jgi:hypothetical protein